MMLNKPVKITVKNPLADVNIDYELVGKILDNFIIMAEERKEGTKIDDINFDCTITFSIGKINEYAARLRCSKTFYIFDIRYLREIPKKEIKTAYPTLPKDRKKLEEAKRQAEEAEGKDSTKKKCSKKKVVKGA